MSITSANGEGAFRLFYDFNRPSRNGVYWCLADDSELPLGTRVLFGCEEDDVFAFGHIISQRNGLYGVAIDGEVFYPSERWGVPVAEEEAGTDRSEHAD